MKRIIWLIVIVLVVIGGYYLWQSRKPTTPKPAQQVQQKEITPSPEAEITLPEQEKEEEIQTSDQPKELPQAGFPVAFILVPSALALASGFKLRRSAK